MEHQKIENQPQWRLGVVSFLNAKPLVAGLDSDPRIELLPQVPSRLANLLDSGLVDTALVPVIDLVQPGRAWQIVSDACIGCDGETFTVRVFSRVSPEAIRTLHVDGDSHTSVALARIIWRELYHQDLNILPYQDSNNDCEAILLIGDKVVNHQLIEHDIETDLGSAWKSMTSLPFVFAVWASPLGKPVDELARLLSEARDRGVQAAELLAEDFGPGQGWPVTLAKRYLSNRIKYHLGEKQRQGMDRFLELAKQHNLVGLEQELVFA